MAKNTNTFFSNKFLNDLALSGMSDSDCGELRWQKATMTVSAFVFSFMAIFWGWAYIEMGLPLSGAIPMGYSVISFVSLLIFFWSKNFKVFRFLQLTFILLLPFLLQWSMGGMSKSGAVMIWSLMAPLGAFFFGNIKYTKNWIIAYIALSIVSGLIDSHVSKTAPPISVEISTLFFTINILFCSIWILFVLQYFKSESEKARMSAINANNAKSQFIANMSHEIRTPLTAILGFARTMVRSPASREQTLKTTKTIIRNGEHLLDVVNDVLDFSKMEAGKIDVERLEVSFFEVISDVHATFSPRFEEKNIQFNVNYKFPLPSVVVTDALRVKQILFNLSSNAFKFTESGSVDLNVNYSEVDNSLEISVIDSGIGMTSEQVNRVFDKYTQAESSTTRHYGGTGLGLSISKNFAQLLGGDLRVSSKIGEGSCFKLSIDCGDPSNSQMVTVEPENTGGDEIDPQQGLQVEGTVLLVDDMLDNRELVGILLTEMGATVTMAENGQEALNQAEKQNFDLILMDMQMPVLGGLEAIKELRERKYSHPIYILTATIVQNESEKTIEYECDGFLTKPIDELAIRLVVSQHLKLKDSELSIVSEKNINDEISPSNSQPITSTYLSNNSTKVTKLITRFINELGDRILKIEDAYVSQDYSTLLRMVHDMKGVGGNLGFPDLTRISIAMNEELTADNINKITLNKLIDELKNVSDRIIAGQSQYEKKS